MVRRQKNNSVNYCIMVLIVIIISIILVTTSLNGKEQENFSPYFETGGCPLNKEWRYLKTYTDQDYYKKHPYIY
jgi:hypothetical protein